MLNFGASKARVKGGARAPGAPPLDPHLGHTFSAGITKHLRLVIVRIEIESTDSAMTLIEMNVIYNHMSTG